MARNDDADDGTDRRDGDGGADGGRRVGRRGVLAAGAGVAAAALGGLSTGDAARQETPNATATPTATPEPADASFPTTPVREERGDVAEIPVSLEGTDRARLVVGSEDMNYLATVTVVDADGDGEVVVTFDTLVAGQGDQSGFGARGEDRVENYQLETEVLLDADETLDPLEEGVYGLQLRVDDLPVAGGAVVLSEGAVEGIELGVAPRSVRGPARAAEAAVPRPAVAAGDWPVLRVSASGIYALLEGADDLNTDRTGLVLRVEETEALNRPPREIPIENVTLLLDPDEDQFFAVLPRDAFEAGSEYEATFEVTDANPFVPEGESRSASTTFEVVGRSATVDGRPPIRLPAGEATVSGTATVAPGTRIVVAVEGTGVADVARTTVEADGTWSATLDLSTGEPGTRVRIRVLDLGTSVRGRLVPPETPAEGTETPGTETPAEGTETPGTETPAEGTETPTEGTETPAEGTETPAEGTETPGG